MVQAVHQDIVSKLEAQIKEARDRTADKQITIQALESSIAELKNQQTQLQDQASNLEVTVGMCTGFTGRLLMPYSFRVTFQQILQPGYEIQ